MFLASPLRTSSLKQEGPLQVSKWLSVQVLLSAEEMQNLFNALEPFHIFCGSSITPAGQSEVDPQLFLSCYRQYVECLASGHIPDSSLYKERFSDFWTVDSGAAYAAPIGQDRQMVRSTRPVVQLQAHSIGYSRADGSVRPQVIGAEGILWGLQFAHPQVFQDNHTGEIFNHPANPEPFINAALYKAIHRWLRVHSQPTCLLVEGKRMNVPMRIGPGCFSWIQNHPQLQLQDIQVLPPKKL